MAQDQVILHFRFATFGDSMLQKMSLLRRQSRFCDVTVRINDLEVPGHRVVLAAGSSFLRDQFILQDSREVQISMTQEAEVGRQLLLSCYTGHLEFPELELVNYLTVASFLQMGHVVEQCTQALKKFIKPREVQQQQQEDTALPSRQRTPEHPRENALHHHVLEEDDDDDGDEEDDDDVIIQPRSPPPPPPPPPPPQRRQRRDQVAAVAGEESSITIVKVESVWEERVLDMTAEHPAAAGGGHHFPLPGSPNPTSSLHSPPPPEPQHSLINSTVDSRVGDMAPAPPASGYHPLSPPPPPTPAAGGKGNPKSMQWYHQCPKCARVFRQLENYANHLKMHKLFMCLLCGKTFTQKGNLHRHMRVHAGIKPFQCKICGKTFTQKCSLLDHLNLHSGDKPHRCNYCDMVFAHKPVLRKHLKQIHGKNSFDNANERSLHDGALEFEYGRLQDCGLDHKPVLMEDSL